MAGMLDYGGPPRLTLLEILAEAGIQAHLRRKQMKAMRRPGQPQVQKMDPTPARQARQQKPPDATGGQPSAGQCEGPIYHVERLDLVVGGTPVDAFVMGATPMDDTVYVE